ncbi:hypothetical protein ACWOFR_06880 [Carnobacterium gallinarum]|uniref:hypothetical protein n=1 Tax=Carnobacterium gallinarum TaxID=2749 RepID=UPI00068F6E21|nr:hypothetical protein [Carnobacterium gallinarum]
MSDFFINQVSGDSKILAYAVDFERATITMTLQSNLAGNPAVYTITFENMLTFYFLDSIKDSILFQIDTCTLQDFIKLNQELLIERRTHNWPVYYETTDQLIEYLDDYTCYRLVASSGLNGWILAKKSKVQKVY